MLAKIPDKEFARATTQEWVRKLSGQVPVAPVLTLQQALDNQYFHDMGAFSISLTRKSMTSK